MKHYPHHIGDFDRATRHLTRIERSIYRDLIDLYYDTEQALTIDREKLCRRIIARSNEEITAVEQVLNEFFTETPTGWYHVRCEEEIEAYRANTSQKAMAGKASAKAKRLKKLQALNGNSTPVDQSLNSVETGGNGTSTNHQPSTINQEPINTQSANVCEFTPGQICKAMKQSGVGDVNPGNPLLKTLIDVGATLDEFKGAAAKAVEGGKGFAYALGIVKNEREQAAQIAAGLLRGPLPMTAKNPNQPMSFAQQDALEKRKRWEEMTGQKWPSDSAEVPSEIIELNPLEIAHEPIHQSH